MSDEQQSPVSPRTEAFLSAAYKRILRMTIVLSLCAFALITFYRGWGSGLGLAAGAVLAYLNFVWLHHAAALTVQRMVAPGTNQPSQQRMIFAFVGRYMFVLGSAYVILKGYPQARIAFMLGLALPILAAMCEGIYEAVANRQ
jgi:hypothetical protein